MKIRYSLNQILMYALGLGVLIFYCVLVLNLNIHGDAKFHTLYAKESAESGYLTKLQPYRIYSFENDERIYMPISYPLTSESLLTVMYTLGGETFLKLYSPFFALAIYFFSVLILRDFGLVKASITGFISVLVIGERLVMTPLIEPFMICSLLAGIYYLKKYLNTNYLIYIILTGFFFAIAASIKQQGLLLTVSLTGIILFLFARKIFVSKKIFTISHYLIYSLIFLSTISIPILEQINRTGTFAFSPGGTTIQNSIPFSGIIQNLLMSKYPVKQTSIEAIRETIGYNKTRFNFLEKIQSFITAPFIYYRSNSAFLYSSETQTIFYLVLTSLLICFLRFNGVFKHNKTFWKIIIITLLLDISISFSLRTPVTQYHSFGLILVTYIIFICLFSFPLINRYIKTFYASIIIYFFFLGYVNYIFPIWYSSGREDNYHLEGYKRMGEFVKRTTPKDSIFFAAETSFRYYSQRDIVWLNESIGDICRTIVSTADEDTAIKELAMIKADYVVINKEQIRRNGVNDYLPPEGLISIIDNSIYFSKIYDAYGDNEMVIYKINYHPNLKPDLAKVN